MDQAEGGDQGAGLKTSPARRFGMVGNRCVGSEFMGLWRRRRSKKVRRPGSFRQRMARVFGKGDGDVVAARAGTKDSRDATQRIPTSL